MNEPFLLVSPKIIISSSEPFALLMLRVEGVAQCPLRRMNTRQCRHLLDTAFGGSAHSYTKGRAILHSIFAYGRNGAVKTRSNALECPALTKRKSFR